MANPPGQNSKPSKSRGLPTRHSGITDWQQADGDTVKRAIERASFVGGAIRFGYSRDGGAYALGIYGDGEPYTVFLPPTGDLDLWLADVADLFDSIADEQASSRKGK